MTPLFRIMCGGLAGAVLIGTAGIDAAEGDSKVYDHILYIAAEDDGTRLVPQLVVQQIPKKDDRDLAWEKAVKRRVRDQQIGTCKPLGVFSNHLIAILMGHLEAIDLSSGQRRSLLKFTEQAEMRGDRVIAMGRQGMVLSEVNLRTLEIRRDFAGRPNFNARSQMALSHNGRFVAATHYPASLPPVTNDPYRIYFIDRHDPMPQPKEVTKHFGCRLIGTGAGDHAQGPVIAWWDEQTLFAVSRENKNPNETFGAPHHEGRLKVQTVNVLTNEVRDVCEIETRLHWINDPAFWRLPDGQLRLHIAALGDFRIDLQEKKLVRDDRFSLTDNYVLKDDGADPALFFKDELLAEAVTRERVSLSPDGKQIAWLPPRIVKQGILMDIPGTLYVHSPEHGKRNIHSAMKFYGDWMTYEPPVPLPNSMVLWITASQLEPMGALAEP